MRTIAFRRTTVAMAAILAVAMVMAACGGGSEESAPDTLRQSFG